MTHKLLHLETRSIIVSRLHFSITHQKLGTVAKMLTKVFLPLIFMHKDISVVHISFAVFPASFFINKYTFLSPTIFPCFDVVTNHSSRCVYSVCTCFWHIYSQCTCSQCICSQWHWRPIRTALANVRLMSR